MNPQGRSPLQSHAAPSLFGSAAAEKDAAGIELPLALPEPHIAELWPAPATEALVKQLSVLAIESEELRERNALLERQKAERSEALRALRTDARALRRARDDAVAEVESRDEVAERVERELEERGEFIYRYILCEFC